MERMTELLNSINYRQATIQDIQVLVNHRVEFLNEILEGDQQGEENLANQLQTYFEEAIPAGEVVNFLALSGDVVVATASMVIWKLPIGYSGIGKEGSGYILNMYTIPTFRRRGICTQLLNLLIKYAKTIHLEKVHLHATQDGIKLYKNLGFKEPYYPELVLKVG